MADADRAPYLLVGVALGTLASLAFSPAHTRADEHASRTAWLVPGKEKIEMLAINPSCATAKELMQLWEQDGLKATRGRTICTDTEYAALLERVRLLEQENAVLQRQVQLLQDLAVLD